MPKFLLSLILICTTSLLWSQESQQEKLEARKAQIQKEIRENEKLLQSVKKKEKSAVNVIVIQSTKIKLKEKLIATTEKQTKLLGNDMYVNQVKINKLKGELEVLKADYAKMIVKSYKSRSEESRAMFILSSENFLQAYKRAQYMKQYTNYRKMQGEEIKSKSDQLLDYNGKLNVQKTAKQKLIAEKEKERLSLEKEKREQEKVVSSIKKDKTKIQAEIRKKQQESRLIDRQVNRIVREAIAAANRKAALERAKANPSAPVSRAPVSSTKIELTPEAKLIADNFRSNRGRLPYPVEKGFISLGYGDQPHPVFSTLTIHNSGVEITTEQGSNARAVFGGEVTSVIVISPLNKAVMVQHGDFFTVYQNLSSVSVSKGDKVSIKQSLGRVRTNSETGKTIIKFLILQNTTYNNPQSWLSPR
ncbi:septal ring factor EnvC (AmiA/AmiB activator) [Flavobacterium sp. CG_23.5]|uniref:murein hydrolase activator EnvC family protein n=1 Tax=unclassified Flavobacterium TaxID=196869 RepID=UPI0018C9BFB7|nr:MULTISPECIES: peptidoglycan DD-metalloendopeptidase family protein [unclassified Flavobacterium]MBG6111723.1 septal ring factor EnvC (AmiA/AmiB activator) [Flavobacterium sp. CG_9.10]MBP2283676.1 septal ring factor EnvC (AmiA/AmiB activator) [Flavobacterium sp. CG_23.5]